MRFALHLAADLADSDEHHAVADADRVIYTDIRIKTHVYRRYCAPSVVVFECLDIKFANLVSLIYHKDVSRS